MRAVDTNVLVRLISRRSPPDSAAERFIANGAWVSTLALAEATTLPRKPSLGFTDCLMLEMARRAGHLPLGTFDRKLARVAETEQL